jgi:hypothetical protein
LAAEAGMAVLRVADIMRESLAELRAVTASG